MEKDQADRGVSGTPFTIMGLLKQRGSLAGDAENIASDMTASLQKYANRKSSNKYVLSDRDYMAFLRTRCRVRRYLRSARTSCL